MNFDVGAETVTASSFPSEPYTALGNGVASMALELWSRNHATTLPPQPPSWPLELSSSASLLNEGLFALPQSTHEWNQMFLGNEAALSPDIRELFNSAMAPQAAAAAAAATAIPIPMLEHGSSSSESQSLKESHAPAEAAAASTTYVLSCSFERIVRGRGDSILISSSCSPFQATQRP
jgi:hypothetical protein